MTFDWNSSAKFENGHHRSHGLAAILEKTSENGHHRSYGLPAILENFQNNYLAISPMHTHPQTPIPPPTHPPLPGAVCKYCTLNSFIIWDMALSLRAGQSGEASCYYYYLYIKIQCSCWLVPLFDFHAPTGRWIGTVHMSKELFWPRNEPRGGYFRIRPHPGSVKGAEAPVKIQIPPILMKFESEVLDTI